MGRNSSLKLTLQLLKVWHVLWWYFFFLFFSFFVCECLRRPKHPILKSERVYEFESWNFKNGMFWSSQTHTSYTQNIYTSHYFFFFFVFVFFFLWWFQWTVSPQTKTYTNIEYMRCRVWIFNLGTNGLLKHTKHSLKLWHTPW